MTYNPSRIKEVWGKICFDKSGKDLEMRKMRAEFKDALDPWYPLREDDWNHLSQNAKLNSEVRRSDRSNLFNILPQEYITESFRKLKLVETKFRIPSSRSMKDWMMEYRWYLEDSVNNNSTTPMTWQSFTEKIPERIHYWITSGLWLLDPLVFMDLLWHRLSVDIDMGRSALRQERKDAMSKLYSSSGPGAPIDIMIHEVDGDCDGVHEAAYNYKDYMDETYRYAGADMYEVAFANRVDDLTHERFRLALLFTAYGNVDKDIVDLMPHSGYHRGVYLVPANLRQNVIEQYGVKIFLNF